MAFGSLVHLSRAEQMYVWRYMVNEWWFLSPFNLNRQPKVTSGKGCMEISVVRVIKKYLQLFYSVRAGVNKTNLKS